MSSIQVMRIPDVERASSGPHLYAGVFQTRIAGTVQRGNVAADASLDSLVPMQLTLDRLLGSDQLQGSCKAGSPSGSFRHLMIEVPEWLSER